MNQNLDTTIKDKIIADEELSPRADEELSPDDI
jgi:hypothetical protein